MTAPVRQPTNIGPRGNNILVIKIQFLVFDNAELYQTNETRFIIKKTLILYFRDTIVSNV